jgi:hypothetical protein
MLISCVRQVWYSPLPLPLPLPLPMPLALIPAELSPLSPLCLSPTLPRCRRQDAPRSSGRCARLPNHSARLRRAVPHINPRRMRQRSPVPEPCSYPGSKSSSWKSALACRTRSQTPLTKLEAVGQVFGTSDPDEGARAAALVNRP